MVEMGVSWVEMAGVSMELHELHRGRCGAEKIDSWSDGF
jgi:hypothetical protein